MPKIITVNYTALLLSYLNSRKVLKKRRIIISLREGRFKQLATNNSRTAENRSVQRDQLRERKKNRISLSTIQFLCLKVKVIWYKLKLKKKRKQSVFRKFTLKVVHLCATKFDNFFQTMKKKLINPSFQSPRLRDYFFFITSAERSETRIQFTDSVCQILPSPPFYATTKVYRGIPSICKVFDDEYTMRKNPSKNQKH